MIELTAQIKVPLDVTWLDYPDNESLAILVYFYGCTNNCEGCHNPLFQSQLMMNTNTFTIKSFYKLLLEECYKQKTNCVVFSGGDCLSEYNVDFTREFLNKYQNIFDICIYTGSTIGEVKEKNITGFRYIKVGKYSQDLKQESTKTDEYFQLASSNQEIYDYEFNLLTDKGRLNFINNNEEIKYV